MTATALHPAIGGNYPPEGDPLESSLDDELVRLAWKALQVLCALLGFEPKEVAGKRHGKSNTDKLIVRKVWFAAMRPHFDPDPAIVEQAAAAKRKRDSFKRDHPEWQRWNAQFRPLYEEARGKVWMLARMADLDRGTVCDDQADVERWCKGNGRVRELMDMVRDMVEPLPGLMEGDFMEELLAEHNADAKKRAERRAERKKAEEDARAAAAEYDAKAAQAVGLLAGMNATLSLDTKAMRRADAAFIQKQAHDKRAAEWEAHLVSIREQRIADESAAAAKRTARKRA